MGDLRGLSDDDDRAPEWAVRLSAPIDWLFAHGHAADLVIAVMLVEGVWLVTVGNWPIATAVLRLLPGALMMVGLRTALVGGNWQWIALPLMLAFPAHLADLIRGRPRPD